MITSGNPKFHIIKAYFCKALSGRIDVRFHYTSSNSVHWFATTAAPQSLGEKLIKHVYIAYVAVPQEGDEFTRYSSSLFCYP